MLIQLDERLGALGFTLVRAKVDLANRMTCWVTKRVLLMGAFAAVRAWPVADFTTAMVDAICAFELEHQNLKRWSASHGNDLPCICGAHELFPAILKEDVVRRMVDWGDEAMQSLQEELYVAVEAFVGGGGGGGSTQ